MNGSPAIAAAPPALEELAGAASPLLARLGGAGAPADFAAATALLGAGQVRGAAGLEELLAAYRERLLFAVELPVIAGAAGHAAAGHARELAALDAAAARRFPAGPFLAASRAVGREQLRRLRPLRDVRVAARFLQEVDREASPGLHVSVCGLLLSAFSLPLRQGLLHYAQAAHGGLVRAGVAALGLNGEATARLDAPLAPALAAHLARLLPPPAWLGAAPAP